MNLMIPFNPSEEARIAAAAKQWGLAPAELIRRLTLEHLPAFSTYASNDVDAKLRLWQEQDATPLWPVVTTNVLFARWANEDAQMTDDEHPAEDRLWEEIENGLAENKGIRLRRLGS